MITDGVVTDPEVPVRRPRPSRLAAVAVLTLGALAATALPAVAQPTGDFGSYVAMGDSYTAGPLIPVQSGLPAGCLRSSANYPSIVAREFAVPVVADVSCSGATTTDLGAAQVTPLGVNPAQLEALNSDVSLVTLGIGGNDIGFASIIADCATRSPLAPLGAACRDFYTAGGTDTLAERVDATAPKIADALAAITDRAPHARVLLVGYPSLLPDEGPGCFPVVPFSPGDVAYLRSTEQRLNTMLAEQAAAADVDFVDTYTPTIGHDMCSPIGTKWIEGLIPTSPAAPAHPNAMGMQALARSVIAAIGDQTSAPSAA